MLTMADYVYEGRRTAVPEEGAGEQLVKLASRRVGQSADGHLL